MRPICWLHISDFHLRDSQAWAQDVVLAAMCQDIDRCRRTIGTIDFVLASGDIAFAGKAHEYDRASAFFDEVARVAGVPRERIFCVPGNHDVDRDLQRMCFAGARHKLQTENDVDQFLGWPDEVSTLLQRQEAYRQFQSSHFASQARTWTADDLAYVSTLAVEDLTISIVGINTAWLAEGGDADHGKLLAGERQIINALQLAADTDAHLVIAMGHHPFHILNDFDRRAVQRRVEEECHFYHCGHLHDPEAHAVNSGAHCLTIAAGASFESRHAHNSFSVVSLDLMQAKLQIKTVQYKPTDGRFSYESETTLPFTINCVQPCRLADLGQEIAAFSAELSPIAHYLAALLTEAQAEMPIQVDESIIFGSFDVLRDQDDCELKSASVAFMAVRNPLRMFAGRVPLAELISRYGETIQRYGTLLIAMADSHDDVSAKLAERNSDARTLAGIEPLKPFAHSLELLHDLANEHDWVMLRQHAERNLNAADPGVALEARRMLALSLAQSQESQDREQAAEIYSSLTESVQGTATDYAALAILQLDSMDYDAAKAVILKGMDRFSGEARAFREVGQRLVDATGDRTFRDKLNAYKASEGSA